MCQHKIFHIYKSQLYSYIFKTLDEFHLMFGMMIDTGLKFSRGYLSRGDDLKIKARDLAFSYKAQIFALKVVFIYDQDPFKLMNFIYV